MLKKNDRLCVLERGAQPSRRPQWRNRAAAVEGLVMLPAVYHGSVRPPSVCISTEGEEAES